MAMVVSCRSSRTRTTWRESRASQGTVLSNVPHGLACVRADASAGPAVFRNLCKTWAACRWDDEVLCTALPSVRVSRSKSGKFPRDGGSPCVTETLATATFLRQLRGSTSAADGWVYYCHGNVLPDALVKDCPTPDFLRG